MGEHPHPHRGGHCDCDDHDGHRRSCEDPDCTGCLAEDAHDPECELCEGTGAYWWEWGPEDAGDCDLCHQDGPTTEWSQGEWLCIDCARWRHAESCGCDAPGWSLDEARP